MTVTQEEFDSRLAAVRQKIDRAASRSGRCGRDSTLLPVTKTLPPSVLETVLAAGIDEVGENRVSEILEKREYPAVSGEMRFHMIGHLQRNKVRDIVGKAVLIHSVDSAELAEKINAVSAEAGIFSDILIEVNAAGEASKFGIAPEDVEDFTEQLSAFEHLCVKGLMTVAPYVDDPEENRPHFRRMKMLFDTLSERSDKYRFGSGKWANVDMTVLSMGMTNDYEIAVEEGATLVRIGTALFGERARN